MGDIELEPGRDDATAVGSDEDAQPLTEMSQAIASSRNRNRSAVLARVVAALARLDAEPDVFGLCVECEEPIAAKRLELMPYVELCVECQQAKDGQRRDRRPPPPARLPLRLETPGRQDRIAAFRCRLTEGRARVVTSAQEDAFADNSRSAGLVACLVACLVPWVSALALASAGCGDERRRRCGRGAGVVRGAIAWPTLAKAGPCADLPGRRQRASQFACADTCRCSQPGCQTEDQGVLRLPAGAGRPLRQPGRSCPTNASPSSTTC